MRLGKVVCPRTREENKWEMEMEMACHCPQGELQCNSSFHRNANNYHTFRTRKSLRLPNQTSRRASELDIPGN